jgi:hypothetical protein
MKDGIFINQAKYTRDLIHRYGMDISGTADTPMCARVIIGKDEAGKDVDQKMYRGIIGSLLYLTASRPDIAFAVGVCARFQAQPKESHLLAAKRIIKYLKSTVNVGIWYPKDGGFKLISYSDSDCAGCIIDRKSTSGTCQMLGTRLVSWFSKKINSISTSTAEAEYIAAGSSCAQVLWIRQQLRDYGVEEKTIPILCDNTSAISITENPVLHSRTKHIDVRHHFIRDHVEKGDIILKYIPTEDQLADIFTKPLSYERFNKLRTELGMIEID